MGPQLREASFGKIQLWAELERKAREESETGLAPDNALFLLYRAGKVCGGTFCPTSRSQEWLCVLFAWGPIGAARAGQGIDCPGRESAICLLHYYDPYLVGFSPRFPGERPGLAVRRCARCGAAYAAGVGTGRKVCLYPGGGVCLLPLSRYN